MKNSEPTSTSQRAQGSWLVYTLAVTLLLGVAWNWFARDFPPENEGLRREVGVYVRASRHLSHSLESLPAPELPRIAVFGSSQIATVKRASGVSEEALPARLRIHLEEIGTPVEIVDFSEGGQQVVESLVALSAAIDAIRADTVVLGLSPFSMAGTEVRETLLEGLDAQSLRVRILDAVPPGRDATHVERLIAFSNRPSQRLSARGETLQQRLDHRLEALLSSDLSAVSNRRRMFSDLIDLPIRRDFVAWVKRRLRFSRTARSYPLGKAYAPSLLAVEVMNALCRSRGIAFLVVVLPFDHERSPIPFSPETMRRVTSDLESLSHRVGLRWVDLSELLATGRFGTFVDGSPDDLHFDAVGHDDLARSLAPLVANLVKRGSS